MALASQMTEDFGGGMYRGRRSPPNAVFDAVDALINDEGLLYKRGGSAYYSGSNAGSTLLDLYDEFLQAGQRTVALSATRLYTLNGSTPVDAGALLATPAARAVGISGMLVIPTASGLNYYAGSFKTAPYSTGTITVTQGSRSVVGVGTSWTANVDAGVLLTVGAAGLGIVESVDSNTTITLRDAWQDTTAAGSAYALSPVVADTNYLTVLGVVLGQVEHVAAVGTPPRLILTRGTRAYFSERGAPLAIDPTSDYHELPQNAQIIGALGVGDTAVLFSTSGIWTVANMSLDSVDAFGNIRHVVSQVNPNLVLWGDRGLAAQSLGQLLVPGIDDIYLTSISGETAPITGGRDSQYDGGIRDLYRSYVKASYQPGLATVYRGHYVVPVLEGTTLRDVLVCRIDRGAAWTRFSGHAAGNAYTVRAGTASAAPKLLGISGQRVTDLSSVFVPVAGNSADADGTVPSMVIVSRDFPLGTSQPGFCQRIRVRAEVTDDANGATAAAVATVDFSSDQDGGSWVALTEKGEQEGGTGWGTSTGARYWFAIVGKRRERIRFRLTFAGGTASTILRSLELLFRPSGKQ